MRWCHAPERNGEMSDKPWSARVKQHPVSAPAQTRTQCVLLCLRLPHDAQAHSPGQKQVPLGPLQTRSAAPALPTARGAHWHRPGGWLDSRGPAPFRWEWCCVDARRGTVAPALSGSFSNSFSRTRTRCFLFFSTTPKDTHGEDKDTPRNPGQARSYGG